MCDLQLDLKVWQTVTVRVTMGAAEQGGDGSLLAMPAMPMMIDFWWQLWDCPPAWTV
jgi:hypothetical protein